MYQEKVKIKNKTKTDNQQREQVMITTAALMTSKLAITEQNGRRFRRELYLSYTFQTD